MRRLIVRAVLAVILALMVLFPSFQIEAATSTASQITNVNCLTASKYFVFCGVPASVTAGQSFGAVTVTVYNSNGKVATGYNGKVYFTSTDSKATLPFTSTSKYTFTTGTKGDKGVHTFSGFNLVTAGSQTITVTDESISATTNVVTVNPSSPTKIQIAPKTATITAGSKQAYTVTATDYFGNSWDVTALASWSITSGAGGSWSGSTYTSAETGTWTVTGSYLNLNDVASLIVNHADAIKIALSPKTPSTTAGTFLAFYATASDSAGNSWDVTNLTLGALALAPLLHGQVTNVMLQKLGLGL